MGGRARQFTCPLCGSHNWGSSYNFDGPGETPPVDCGPGRPPLSPTSIFNKQAVTNGYTGTWTRHCHGPGACKYQWNSRDDVKHGILPPSGSAHGVST
jgi:hypothetical protein